MFFKKSCPGNFSFRWLGHLSSDGGGGGGKIFRYIFQNNSIEL